MRQPPIIEWRRVLIELRDAGFSRRMIAREANCSVPYIDKLLAGRRIDPAYTIGSAIVSLHVEHCTRSLSSVSPST